MSRSLIGLLTALLVVLFVISACGPSEPWVPEDDEPTEQTTAAAQQDRSIVMYQYRFNPNTLTIPSGTTVTFQNRDPERHNVTIAALNIDQTVEPNQEWSYTFNTTGEFAVSNRFTSTPMRLTIIVQ